MELRRVRIGVWYTGHAIADEVAKAVHAGIPDASLLPTHQSLFADELDLNIGYGILRGMQGVFQCSGKPYIHLDRGYFKPGHYDGYYRVSLRGTQQTSGWPEPDYERLAALKLDIKPWRGFDHSKPVLVCPPTEHVWQFFGHPHQHYWMSRMPFIPAYDMRLRPKGDPTPINFTDYNYVLTFNSSVGWQALQAGIPCVSNPTHSIVGAYFGNISPEELQSRQCAERESLFAVMSALQLTLDEIRQGKLWELIQRLMSSSATMAEKPPVPTLPHIA